MPLRFPTTVLFMMIGALWEHSIPCQPFRMVNPSIVEMFAPVTTFPLPPPSITVTLFRQSL